MKDESRITQNVEEVVSAFFEAGHDDDRVHTLHLDDAIADEDQSVLEAALSQVAGVERLYIDQDKSCIHVVSSSSPAPLVEAIEQAGYGVKTAN